MSCVVGGIRLGRRISRPLRIHEELPPHGADAGHDVAAQVVGRGRLAVHGHGHALEAEAVRVPNEAVEGGGRWRDLESDVAFKGAERAQHVRVHVAHPSPSIRPEDRGRRRRPPWYRSRGTCARRAAVVGSLLDAVVKSRPTPAEILALDRRQADLDPRLMRAAGIGRMEPGARRPDSHLRHVRGHIVRGDDGERAALAEVLARRLGLRQRAERHRVPPAAHRAERTAHHAVLVHVAVGVELRRDPAACSRPRRSPERRCPCPPAGGRRCVRPCCRSCSPWSPSHRSRSGW